MAAKCSIAPAVIWNWVIEALASFEEVDISTLIGLAKNAEISSDLGKDAREMVALRILESLFVHSNETILEGDSAQHAKISFDVSKRCANVLRQILRKTPNVMANLEKEKWDVRPFLVHKRSSLPKCMLKKLKEAILEDSHPLLALLKERSKLEMANTSENCDVQNTVAKDNIDFLNPRKDEHRYQEKVLQEADQVGNFNEGTIKHTGREEHETFIEGSNGNKSMEHDWQHKTVINSDRMENCDVQNTVAKDDIVFLNPRKDENEYQEKVLQEADQVGNSTVGTTKHTGREERETFIECPLEASSGNKLMEHDNQLETVTNSDRKANCDVQCTVAKDDIALNLREDENKYQEKVLQEADQTGNSTEGTTKHTGREECEISIECPLEGSSGNKLMEHDDQLETVTNRDRADDKRTDITFKYEAFLKSCRSLDQDFFAGIEWAEIDLCMKCDEGGQLLVCSSDACPLRVHESCLGSAVTLDENGKFFCPVCVYSRAISEYREAERKASLARKDLQAFSRFTVKHTPKKSTKKHTELDKNEDRQIGAFEMAEGNHNQHALGRPNNINCMSNHKDSALAELLIPVANDDLSCGEMGAAVPVTNAEHVGEGYQSPTGMVSLQNVNDRGLTIPCFNGNENGLVTGEHTDRHIQNEGLNQQPTASTPIPKASTQKQKCNKKESHTTVEYSCSRNCYKRKAQYTPPAVPLTRRKILPWTETEEETLKEGVQRYSSVDYKGIPWKEILDFGCNVFHKGRTSVDLKDKWRKICEGSPDVK